MKIDKIRQKVVALAISGALCLGLMCFFVDNTLNYTSAENAYKTDAISANAEIPETLSPKEKTEFDDSIWGRLAMLMRDIIEAWQP